MIQIDSSQVHGEIGTGYEGADGKGPFACHNCTYFRNGSCGQSTMMEVSKQPRTENGRVVVDSLGCCEYVERIDPKPKKKHWLKRGKS